MTTTSYSGLLSGRLSGPLSILSIA